MSPNRLAQYLNCTPAENEAAMTRLALNSEVVKRQGALHKMIESAEHQLESVENRLEKRRETIERRLALPKLTEAARERGLELLTQLEFAAATDTVRLKAQLADYRLRLKALKIV